MHHNVISKDPQTSRVSFYSPGECRSCPNKYDTPPHIPGGRNTVRSSRMHQNARSVDPQFCSETFHSSRVNVVPCRNEYATLPFILFDVTVRPHPSSIRT
ncbi:hypothetical protein TNCT_257911 [Trichonephila clavata]|uniref:Uncharacterized protein n=1 Tax=Trichonephila clavata TaxID=2740835 RepID=A0A8X6KTY4_TRICU|nr:hypothetical protein TNCT_257911 [Trichonephila clavata]